VEDVIKYAVELRVNIFVTASNILVALPSDTTSRSCDSVVKQTIYVYVCRRGIKCRHGLRSYTDADM
jgi:hypothetical protein